MYCSYFHYITKLASMDGASLCSALVAVTGSRIARCPGRTFPGSGQMLQLMLCVAGKWVLLSNCNSNSSPHVPGDQELLKSWHGNSIWWFITMSFIDPGHAEGLIQPGT